MKAWLLAGLATMVMAPSAFAAESTEACQVDDARRATQERAEAPPVIPPSVAAAVRPTAQRDVARRPRAPSHVAARASEFPTLS
ncbi:MAG: hypothetical protein M0D54_08355 [Hyphomonadaceae bacterium JAD_PAG50586_4]|nr:MAG: hypothetical protein M0D54_08355 [Hyphomonadaceae bacterium JAD_PAG50586_4]